MTWVSLRGRRVLAMICAGGFLACVVVYAVWLGPLERVLQSRGHGIVDLELAWSRGTLDTILTDWGPEGVAAAREQIVADFAFIPAYAVTVWSALLLVARPVGGWLARWAHRLAPLVWLAAAGDVLENLALLRAISTFGSAAVAVASTAATVKFLILLAAVVVIAMGVCALGWRRVAGREK